jgi:hypothetical protein
MSLRLSIFKRLILEYTSGKAWKIDSCCHFFPGLKYVNNLREVNVDDLHEERFRWFPTIYFFEAMNHS